MHGIPSNWTRPERNIEIRLATQRFSYHNCSSTIVHLSGSLAWQLTPAEKRTAQSVFLQQKKKLCWF